MRRFASVLSLLAMAGATPAVAQHLEMIHGTGSYGAFGLGGGNFKLTCTGCSGASLSASDIVLMFGHKFGGRLRGEIGAHFLRNSGTSSTLLLATAGASLYLIPNLYVRGAATYQKASIEDSTAAGVSTYDGKGGPGFMVGAGYELFIGDQVALTPYVNYASGTISSLTQSGAGPGTVSGSVRALNFGLSIGRSARHPYRCVTTNGVRVVRDRSNPAPFQSCVNEVATRLGRAPIFK